MGTRLDQLQPWLLPYWRYASDWFTWLTGVRPTVTSTYRSLAEQQELYDSRFRNPYPVNRPGDSAHNYGLAIDSDVPDQLMPLWTAVRRAVGFRVPDNDVIHAEVPNWRDLVRARMPQD